MNVGDRVKLICAPAGWGDVAGHVIADDEHGGDLFETDDMMLVEWSNGETCYENPAALTLANFRK